MTMKSMTPGALAEAVHGKYEGPLELLDKEITAVVTDSRQTVPGCMYAAIRGERVDGHRFIPDVIDRGAMLVLAEQSPEKTEQEYGTPKNGNEVPTIVVSSVLQALKDAAEYYRSCLNIPIVGIIGSVGKTSTKEMVASVLGSRYRVLKTEGNFNNEIGVPMTIFRIREEHEIAVVEMGINHFGEMHRLAKIVRPDTVVMTNIGTAHLEFLKTRDGILKAKSEVFDYFNSDGHIVLNGDDDKLSTIQEKNNVVPLRFGLHQEGYSHPNDLYAENVEKHGLDGISCEIHMPAAGEKTAVDDASAATGLTAGNAASAAAGVTAGENTPAAAGQTAGDQVLNVMIPSPGIHMIYNALAGAAVGAIYGLTPEEISRGIAGYTPIAGRFHILHEENGRHLTIIDDCYNANPASVRESLSVLSDAGGRRVAILGDMGELGENERELHAEAGRFAAEKGIDALFCAGPLSAYMAEAAHSYLTSEGEKVQTKSDPTRKDRSDAPAEMDIRHFDSREQLMAALPELMRDGDIVLVKASHFMQFDKITEALVKL